MQKFVTLPIYALLGDFEEDGTTFSIHTSYLAAVNNARDMYTIATEDETWNPDHDMIQVIEIDTKDWRLLSKPVFYIWENGKEVTYKTNSGAALVT